MPRVVDPIVHRSFGYFRSVLLVGLFTVFHSGVATHSYAQCSATEVTAVVILDGVAPSTTLTSLGVKVFAVPEVAPPSDQELQQIVEGHYADDSFLSQLLHFSPQETLGPYRLYRAPSTEEIPKQIVIISGHASPWREVGIQQATWTHIRQMYR